MKKSIFIAFFVLVSALFFTIGCMDRVSPSSDTLMADTIIADTTASDSLSQLIEEEQMPEAADELFDDFFFNYAGSRKVQRERTLFPLPIEDYGKTSQMQKQDWRFEHFFMSQGYYTLIFNNAKQANLMKDTTVNNVTVERISVSKGTVKHWHFSRVRGLWQMNKVETMALSKHPDAAFLKFYHHFATDSAFQQKSVADPVVFTGPDPDDDFSTMTGEVLPEQWPMFAPQLPSGIIYNIIYGAKPYANSDVRFFYIRGIANGYQTDLIFTRKGNSWQLKKINT